MSEWPHRKTAIHHSAATDYYKIDLSRNGEQKTHRVHRLIMAAFRGPCPEGQIVCHGEGGSLDNRLENLKYDTQSENIRYNIWMQSQQEKADSGSEDNPESDVVSVS